LGIVQSPTQGKHDITVFNPSIVKCPGVLRTGPVGSQIGEVLIPGVKPVVGSYRHDILSHHVADEEELRITEIEYIMTVTTINLLSGKIAREFLH
jgi:hypothetical protein